MFIPVTYREINLVIIYLFTNDLRLHDNPGFSHALEDAKKTQTSSDVIPLYIHQPHSSWPIQGAAAWWLHHSLKSLNINLRNIGGELCLRKGHTLETLKKIIATYDGVIDGVYFSRAYDPIGIEQQQTIFDWCKQQAITCKRFAGSLLFEPEAIQTQQGSYFKVFTPFYRNCKMQTIHLTHPSKKIQLTTQIIHSDNINTYHLLPQKPNWASEFSQQWEPGETGAHQQLQTAIDDIIANYKDQRDIPSIHGTSQLSAHLRFGEITPRQIFQSISAQLSPEDAEPFLRQIFWREFNHHLLFHVPNILNTPFKPLFENFPWQTNNEHLNLKKWQQGKTGYPIVDAGMRQLWQTGWMHNRVRMIVASFLTKHLGIHWKTGADWFWDTLVDADLANNSGGWQWVAGCGADAAPYFRIFNPIIQGERFDPNGEYVKRWVPELKDLPKKYIHSPWIAPQFTLQAANITLGKTYPHPIVDHKTARDNALAAYASIKKDVLI